MCLRGLQQLSLAHEPKRSFSTRKTGYWAMAHLWCPHLEAADPAPPPTPLPVRRYSQNTGWSVKLWHEVPSSTGLLPLRLFIQKEWSFHASNQTSEDFNFFIASSFFFLYPTPYQQPSWLWGKASGERVGSWSVIFLFSAVRILCSMWHFPISMRFFFLKENQIPLKE